MIPEEALSRTEKYLNKLATGEGDIPKNPKSRIEQYLNYICINGSLNNESGSECSMITDLGNVSGLGGFGAITGLPQDISCDVPFVAYKNSIGPSYVFSQNFSIDNKGVGVKAYYFRKKPSTDWNFSQADYTKPSNYVYDSKNDILEVITNCKNTANDLISIGISENMITCTAVDTVEVKQLRANTNSLSNYKGKQGQLVVNTDDNSIHVMDGETLGGHKISPMSTISQSNITDLEERILRLESMINSI